MSLEADLYPDQRLFVVFTRLMYRAANEGRWSDVAAMASRMDPLVGRLGRKHATLFAELSFQLARACPDGEAVKYSLVAMANRYQIYREAQASPDRNRPVAAAEPPHGEMSHPSTLRVGEVVSGEQSQNDINSILRRQPHFALAIENRRIAWSCETISFVPGWRLVEAMVVDEEKTPMAAKAFIVSDDEFASISPSAGAFLQLGQRGSLALDTPELAADYVRAWVALFEVNQAGRAGVVLEPGRAMPFSPDLRAEGRDLLRAAARPLKVQAVDGGYLATGTMGLFGEFYELIARLTPDGQVDVSASKPLEVPGLSDFLPSGERPLFEHRINPFGWRVLRRCRRQSDLDTWPSRLPDDTLPAEQRFKTVVSPVAIETFAGLPLRAIAEEEQARLKRAQEAVVAANGGAPSEDRSRIADLAFLPETSLVLVAIEGRDYLTPVFANDERADLAMAERSWLYTLVRASDRRPATETATAFIRLFLAFVIGPHGRFTLLETIDSAPWSDEATQADRERVSSLVSPINFLGKTAEEDLLYSFFVAFQTAVFRVTCRLKPDWEVDFRENDMVLTDLPFRVGPAIDFVVRE